mmetsp:Transcript_44986/g.106849  ORF Transcript_44986/g.106849 Transcript_44986/m.106849 type:complete len:559 (+) Transcript_44986:103-1779(+)
MSMALHFAALLGAVVTPLSVAVASAATAAPKRRNVLFIVVDDMRPTIGAYNFTMSHTPAMDALAAEGVTFTRAYVQMAVCSPSRMSFLSGRRPDTTQTWNFKNNFREPDVGPDWASLPGYFRQHGYVTLGSGKLYHPHQPPDYDYAKSWSQEWPYFDPECRQKAMCPSATPRPAPKPSRCLDWEPRTHVAHATTASPVTMCMADIPANESRPEYQLEDMLTRDSCIEQLKTAKATGKNFFVGCGFRKPHVDWVIPAEFWDYFPALEDIPLAKYTYAPAGVPHIAYHLAVPDVKGFEHVPFNGTFNATRSRIYRRAYYAAVAFTDYNIGKVLAALDDLELKNDTAVVVFGDHGWHLGEAGLWAKMTNFENAARIPLILRAPWIEAARGKVTNVLAEAVDLYPTLTELAGLPDPKAQGEELNGTSLVPVLEDAQNIHVKKAAFSQYAKHSVSKPFDINPNFNKHQTEALGYSVRVENWRYSVWFRVPTGLITPDTTHVLGRELYPHFDDSGDFDFPGENANLVDDPQHEDLVEELHRMILDYIQVWPRGQEPSIGQTIFA